MHVDAPIKLLIIDDSAVVRQVLTSLLSSDPRIHVMQAAADPIIAMQRMREDWPDVILLDVEMPRMDGLTFLKRIMADHPTPVIICSTLTEAGATTTLQALALGAVAYMTKPHIGLKDFLAESRHELIRIVRQAAKARPKAMKSDGVRCAPFPSKIDASVRVSNQALADTTDRVIAIGTSTGGTQALETVLVNLPRTVKGVVIVQHMPEKFTSMFAQRLDALCNIDVIEARSGDRVLSGRALIAPGGKHLRIIRNGAQYVADVRDGPLINRHKPSVDVLFRSVAECAGANALGIIMTGMGDDGARGLLDMHTAGAHTLAQDEASCVVYGMPMEAVKLGAVDEIVSLSDIAGRIIQYSHRAPMSPATTR